MPARAKTATSPLALGVTAVNTARRQRRIGRRTNAERAEARHREEQEGEEEDAQAVLQAIEVLCDATTHCQPTSDTCDAHCKATCIWQVVKDEPSHHTNHYCGTVV